MKILIVGAGAVGLVYGYSLAQGGAKVSFFVKDKYVEEARQGFSLYPLNESWNVSPVLWKDADIYSSLEKAAAQEWDQVWLCVSATAIRGSWLKPFTEKIRSKVWISLQPGLEDGAYISQYIDEKKLVQGVITLISYQTPLLTEMRAIPGIAYWFPPFTPNPFSGEKEQVQLVVNALKAGGCPAVFAKDAAGEVAYLEAVMMSMLVLLESENWSFSHFLKSKNGELMRKALHQAIEVVAAYRKETPPFWRFFVRMGTFRFILFLSNRVIPIDLETYLAYHFTKVGDQTKFMMQTYIDRGSELGHPTEAIEQLLALLPSV